MNREFGAFLLSDLGRQVMTKNKLSIHVESGDIFYENHNTGENFYNFFLFFQNDDAAFIPKKFSYCRSFESYISQFLQAFSIDDVEKCAQKFKMLILSFQGLYKSLWEF